MLYITLLIGGELQDHITVSKVSLCFVEPCILVMYHSMRPHPAITATLLDFMCRVCVIFISLKDLDNCLSNQRFRFA